MPRVNIFFTDKVLNDLRDYIRRKYEGHRAMSLIVQRAVAEFLNREKQGGDSR